MRVCPTPNGAHHDVALAIVDSDGALLQTDIVVSSDAADERDVAIAGSGAGYLVAWRKANGAAWDVSGRLVDLAGATTSAVFGAATGAAAARPAAASNGSNYMMAWQVSDDIAARSVSSVAAVGSVVVVAAETAAERAPAVAASNAQYLLVWADNRNTTWDIYARRLDSMATPVASAFAVDASIADQASPFVAQLADGSGDCLAAWSDARFSTDGEIYGGVIAGSGGMPYGTWPMFNVVNEERGLQVAFNGENYLAVWQDARNANWDIYGVGVEPDGTVLQPSGVAISTAAGDQSYPSVAALGATFLVAWEDRGNANADIYGTRVSA